MLIHMLIQQPRMLGAIVRATPVWVWALLAGLVALGISQLFTRRVSLLRMALLPAAMTGFALYGMVAAFAGAGQPARPLAAWLLAAAACAIMVLRLSPDVQPGTAYQGRDPRFTLPGSWSPLLLILGIFLTKYYVGVQLAMQPDLARDAGFALTVALVYGVFNGIFVARFVRLWRLGRQQRCATPDASTLHLGH